jgi:hypothetical protein
VEAVRPTPENYERTPGYNIDFRITSGPTANPGAGVGRVITRYCSMGGKEGSQFAVAGVIGAAGQAAFAHDLLGRLKGRAMDYAMFVQVSKLVERAIKGKYVVLTIVDEISQQGRPFSSVLEVQADANWETLQGTPLVGAAMPPNGSGPAPAAASTVSMAEAVQGMFEAEPDA